MWNTRPYWCILDSARFAFLEMSPDMFVGPVVWNEKNLAWLMNRNHGRCSSRRMTLSNDSRQRRMDLGRPISSGANRVIMNIIRCFSSSVGDIHPEESGRILCNLSRELGPSLDIAPFDAHQSFPYRNIKSVLDTVQPTYGAHSARQGLQV